MAIDRTVDGPVRAGDVVGSLFGGAAQRKLSAAQVAARAWYAANGDRERAHTTGVWLRKSGRTGVDPVLVVRLDSALLAQELGTNKDLYLSRIAHAGVRVSDIRFNVGRPSAGTSQKRAGRKKAEPRALRELSEAELKKVEEATSGLPERLRKSVSRAMCATMARETNSNT